MSVPMQHPIQHQPTRHQATGEVAWWSGLLAMVPLPFVTAVVASLVMVVLGRAQRHNGPVAAENGRRAANWGMAYLIGTVLLVGGHFGLLYYLESQGYRAHGFFPVGTIITVWLALSAAHLVLCVIGGVQAHGEKVTSLNGLPAFRR